MDVRSINRLGWVSLVILTVMVAPAFPLRCFPAALRVASISLMAGAALAVALAMVTRTRSPLGIYLWLASGVATLSALLLSWPQGDQSDVILWRGAPAILSNYLDLLRYAAYITAFPFPFARFGRHAPDPAEPTTSDQQD